MGYYSDQKKTDTANIQLVESQNIILSEINQIEKNAYSMISFV